MTSLSDDDMDCPRPEGGEHSEMAYDTGGGRWFVLARSGSEWGLAAGPYQTDAAMERWMEIYEPAAGVEHVHCVRCEGTWRDAIPHAEFSIEEFKRHIKGFAEIVAKAKEAS